MRSKNDETAGEEDLGLKRRPRRRSPESASPAEAAGIGLSGDGDDSPHGQDAEANEDNSPTRMTDSQLAAMLSRASGEPFTAADIPQDAPRNPDGSIHFLHFSAWLARHRISVSRD